MNKKRMQTALKEAQMGDREAFGEVYSQVSARVSHLCRKILGSKSSADDATSEVFERAHNALEHYDTSRPFDPWILSIATRHCLNLLRRRRKEEQLFCQMPVDSPAPAEQSSPLKACESQEQREQMRAAIESLPENYRIPLVLKYYADLSYDDIANQIGTTRANVAVLLHRSKIELRGRINAQREDSP